MTADSQSPGMANEIHSLDEVPSAEKLVARQQFLSKWWHSIAIAPFACDIFLTLGFFANSTNRLFVILLEITLVWAMAVAAYAFYLLVSVKCPRCGQRFGSGDSCRSCGLPKHAGTLSDVESQTLLDGPNPDV